VVRDSSAFVNDFRSLILIYKHYPFVSTTIGSEVDQIEFKPVASDQCYLSISLDSDANMQILVDSSGTFDNLAYDTSVVTDVIDDVLHGNVSKKEIILCGMVCSVKLVLLRSKLVHRSTNPWLLPMLLFTKRIVVETRFQSYLGNSAAGLD